MVRVRVDLHFLEIFTESNEHEHLILIEFSRKVIPCVQFSQNIL